MTIVWRQNATTCCILSRVIKLSTIEGKSRLEEISEQEKCLESEDRDVSVILLVISWVRRTNLGYFNSNSDLKYLLGQINRPQHLPADNNVPLSFLSFYFKNFTVPYGYINKTKIPEFIHLFNYCCVVKTDTKFEGKKPLMEILP